MWFSLNAVAATWNIPADYPTIREALASAAVVDGDVLQLAAQNHPGADLSLNPRNELVIRGLAGATVTPQPGETSVFYVSSGDVTFEDLVIDGSMQARGLEVTGEAVVTVRDTVIQDTVADGQGIAAYRGGGILARFFALVRLETVSVVASEADDGGALATADGGTILGSDVTVVGCTAHNGGAIDVDPEGTVELTGVVLDANVADRGGAVNVGGVALLDDAVVSWNIAGAEGGGVHLDEGELRVANSLFRQNTSDNDGGAIGGRGNLVGDALGFFGNEARHGGAIDLRDDGPFGPSQLDNVAFCGNYANQAEGHAIRLDAGATLGVSHALFAYNAAGGSGTTVASDNGGLSMAFATFYDNPGPYAAGDIGSDSSIVATVFATSGLRVQGGQAVILENAFHPLASIEGSVDLTEQIVVDPQIVDPGACEIGVAFPYPTAAALIDQATAVDDDGSPGDLGHLGGAGLNEAFWNADADGDGFRANLDCDDANPAIRPGATETCDGVDNDCDGDIDESGATVYADGDGDGFGALGSMGAPGCPAPGWVTAATDCDDTDHAVFPGAPEQCDGIDNDCAGGIDDGLPPITGYRDHDGDGYGDDHTTSSGCSLPTGYLTTPGDCDDTLADVNPGESEQCDGVDNDCSGVIDDDVITFSWWLDDDGDGFGATGTPATVDCAAPSASYVDNQDDCDDADPSINPDAPEQCDSIDHDCDGDPLANVPLLSWYLDVDQDGFGAGTAVSSCSAVANHVLHDGDCDDADLDVNPGADELCDTIDNDCDGLIDDDDDVPDAPDWFADHDGDTYGDPEQVVYACVAPAGHVGRAGDCDDAQPNVNEGAPEACIDGLDNDCDGLTDDQDPDYSFTGVEWGDDSDGDGYGWPVGTVLACSGEQPLGWVPMNAGADCDDAVSAVNPGAEEICNGIDDDCVGGADDGLAFLDYFLDGDLDGFGDPGSVTVNACRRPAGRVGNGLDCDDADPARHPYAVEVCNGIDDDCDNTADDGLDTWDWYPDDDGDGYGDATAEPVNDCTLRDGEVLDATDCDDADATVNPGADDDPDDGIDSDCDGTVEEPPPPAWVDTDGDGVPDAVDNDPARATVDGARPSPTEPAYGCGCDSTGAPWLLGALVPLLGLRRR